MDRFANAELADTHLMDGAAQENGAAAERMRRTGIGRYRRTPTLEQRILNTVDNNPSTSSRAVGRALGVSHQSALRTLHEDRMHPYHLQRVQAITPDDYPRRLNFDTWYLQQTAENQTFSADVLFTDEATFTRSGMFNMHYSHLWAHVNPHGTITHAYQETFSINVWAGIVHNNLVGPYILPSRLTGRTYNISEVQEVLPELLVEVPPSVRSRMGFQHDGAPAHFSRNVRNPLDTVYGQHWIGRGHIKSLVYESPVTSAEDLVARFSVAAGHVIDMPDVFSDLSRSMRRRCECCVTVGGRTFEHLL
ncbi:uncharacterized protein TNCV_2486141 [Trichonephila clavipes]|uniref:Transposase n=1 Tax=Trichonephila clavipes TaxID=2585209 RepID=A0A8X6VZT9_TRICX|nr:uncharacterized protein TNCV_2486141 [Trichonephila clavipes]